MEAVVAARGRPSSNRQRSGDGAGRAATPTMSACTNDACELANRRGPSHQTRAAAKRQSSASADEITFTVIDDWSDPIPIASGELNALETFLLDELRRFLPGKG